MALKTGLRTEIVISTVLLLGAALLFAGFLLVKLTERELLDERRAALRRTAGLIAATAPPPERLSASLAPLVSDGELVAWRLAGSDRVVLMSFALGGVAPPDVPSELPTGVGTVVEQLLYSSTWNPFRARAASFLDLTVPVEEPSGGLLQLRFSLESLVAQVHRAQRLILVYVVLYGAVLSAFGIFLLNRNVVAPVRRLRAATAGIAAGDLTPIDAAAGPGEIRDLADDFNGMIAALRASRAETAAHINSLQEANLALKQARDEIVRAEKMASVGHLAAGMAHEIGNPLAAVVGYLNLLGTDLADPAQRDLVVRSLAEAGRIDRLVRDLLDYAAPAPAVVEPFDPLAAARDAVALLVGQGALDGVRIDDRAPDFLGKVRMDRGRFVQVCVNLLLNARDAMPRGGAITLTAAADREFTLTLADNGAGMAPATLGRIFEPFYTTKDPGKGRGLGLAVCQRLLDEAGGGIEARSTPGEGSAFTLRLPLVREGG